MTEPVLTEEKTPVSFPPSLTLTKPPALMSTQGESSTSGLGPSSVQSSAGNLAVQRAAAEPDRITTPEGDNLPTPVIVGWAEPFEITFSARTTPYGDVHLLIRFRYRGTQTLKRPQDQDLTMELLPAPENPTLGVSQDRRLNVRIINNSNTTLVIDPYGDGKVTYAIDDEALPPKPNGTRDHHIAIYRNNEPGANASFTMAFTSTGGKPVTETGTGTVVPVAPTVTKPTHEPDPARTPDLSANLLMEMAIGRLHDLKIRPLSLLFWEVRLRRDLPTNMSIANEPTIRRRLRRLLDLLAYMGPVFTTLEALTEKEQYLGGLADVATARVREMVGLYGEAILSSYYGESPTNEPLVAAEKLLAEFPGWLNNLYLRDPRGVKSLIEKIPELQDELLAAQDLNDSDYSERLSRADSGVNRLDKLTMIIWKGKTPGTLYGTREAERQDVEWAWRGEKDVQERIKGLYTDVQFDIGVLTAMTVYEQLRYLSHELNTSLINDVIELTPAADRAKQASDYATQLWHIVNEFEANSYLSEGKEKQAAVHTTLENLQKLLQDAQFQSGVEDIQSRLKWVNRIDFVGKLALIIAAATLTGGVAGSLAAELGAGSFLTAVATGFGFTVASRLGQQLAFGKVEGSFIGDWFWNTITLGVLKAASTGLARIIRLPAGAGGFTKLGVKLGRAGGAMIALHGVAEVQTLLTKQRLMTWDERGEAMITNAVLMATLHAGKFITDPIEARITKGVVDKLRLNKRIADRIDRVAADRLALKNRLAELENGDMPPREVDKVIDEIGGAWYEELKIIDDAASGERPAITKSELDTALSAHREHIAGMQLQMSQIGVEAPSPSGHTTFRPIEPEVVAFAPEGRSTLEAFYAADPAMPGKSLTESASMPGVLEGRMPTGELTYFVPEGETAPLDVLPSEAAPAPKAESPPTAAAEPPKIEPSPRVEPTKPIVDPKPVEPPKPTELPAKEEPLTKRELKAREARERRAARKAESADQAEIPRLIEEIQKEIKANDKEIAAAKKEIEKAKAKLEQRYEKRTSLTGGSEETGGPRKFEEAKAAAKQAILSAQKNVAVKIEIEQEIEARNDELYKEAREYDEIIHPEKYPKTAAEKGRIGEAEGHKWMIKEGYKFIASSQKPVITDAVGEVVPGPGGKEQGLDGVYEKPGGKPPYVIAEMKYVTDPNAPASYGESAAGKQGTKPWVEDNLEQAVGRTLAVEIRKAGYECWELRYDPAPGVEVAQKKLF